MNIFYLDDNIDTCAKFHVDSHVKKIPLEMGQMLTANMWIDHIFAQPMGKLSPDDNKYFKQEIDKFKKANDKRYHYWPAYMNHPCTIWLRESAENYYWGVCYANQLDWERYVRFLSRMHASVKIINSLPEPRHFVTKGWTTPALAVGDSPRYEDDPVRTYREYYINYKSHLHAWTLRNPPKWITS